MANFSIESAVDDFFADADVQRLMMSTATCHPLTICFPREVNVSRMLAWLLDPTEGHGLGDLAVQSLLTRAWGNCDEADIPIATRRFLAPSNIQSEGFSSAVVTTEVDLNGRSLDVLVVDTARRRYVAIENKFGSKQSASQLKDYRKSLEKLFPEFLGIYILLDSKRADPLDESWITIGYDWLADFLREAEHRSSTAQHVRDALSQFREVIEEVSADSMGRSPLGRLITEVAGSHPQVFEQMEVWATHGSKGARAKILAKLAADATTLEGKAMLRLFQLYWRRSSVWDQCIKQAQFAPFVYALRQRFDDLEINTKRVWTTFSLSQWDSLLDMGLLDELTFPAGVIAEQTGETFRVSCFIHLSSVRPEKREALIRTAETLRKNNGLKRRLRDEQSTIYLKRVKDLDLPKAVQEAVSQCASLQGALDTVR